MNKDKLQQQLKDINDEIDDVVENLKYLLIHVEIENINLIQINQQLNQLLINRKLIENELFIDEIYK